MVKIAQPQVYLVGETRINQEVLEELLADESATWIHDEDAADAELLVELAGRLCYMSFGEKQGRKSTAEYLANILEMAHGSVLEHAVYNFVITGVSRSFSHELVRHRAGTAISQLNQRYVDESDTRFVVPPLLREMQESTDTRYEWSEEIWKEAVGQCLSAYEQLTKLFESYLARNHAGLSKTARRKRAREAARSVLPNATETKMMFSANARALRHIIALRGAPEAEAEIREVAYMIAVLMAGEAPRIFPDLAFEVGSVSLAHRKV